AQAKKNSALLTALLDVSAPHETRQYARTESGLMAALAEPTVEEQFATAFRRWDPDLDLDHMPLEEISKRLQSLLRPVLPEVVAGLEAWMIERRQHKEKAGQWQRLLGLANLLDTNQRRQEVRGLLLSDQLLRERIVRELSHRFLPRSALP